MTETNVSLTLDATNAFLPGSTSDVLVEPDQDVKSAARFLPAHLDPGRQRTVEVTNGEKLPPTYSFTSNRQGDPETPRFPVRRRSRALDSVLAIQKWEGYVVQVEEESFAARLIDLAAPGAQEDGEFATCELSPDDLPLLKMGAVFY